MTGRPRERDIEARLRRAFHAETLPPGLRRRLRARLAAIETPQDPSFARILPRAAPLVAACAGLVLALGIVLTLGRAPAPLDAPIDSVMVQPVMEFRSFIDSDRPLDLASSDPLTVQLWLESRVDFALPETVPAAPRLRLTGARLCSILGRRAASYMYVDRAGDAPISLYVMRSEGLVLAPDDAQSLAAGRAIARRFGDFGHVIWARDGLIYSLVSPLEADQLRRVSTALSVAL